MKRLNYIIGSLLLVVIVTIACAAPGDKSFTSVGNFFLDSGSVIKILTELRVDSLYNANGSQKLPGFVPVGGMIAVMPNTNSKAWQPDSGCAIKDGFMRAGLNSGTPCVVPTCADCGIPAGTTLPNMVGKFIRGNTTSNTAAGGNVVVAVANVPQISSTVTYTGVQSIGHTHNINHGHPSNVTDGNNQDHTHDATHTHGGSSSDDSTTHTHPLGTYGHAAHEHYFTNSGGETHTTNFGANTGPVATFRFAPSQVNGTCYWDDMFTMRSTGAHSHGGAAASDAAGGHGHDATGIASGNSSTSGNTSTHAHGTLSATNSLVNSATDHSHNVTFSFANGGQAVNTTPTNIEVVWVIRVR